MTQDNRTQPSQNLARIEETRLPYIAGVQERFGIDRGGWRALVDAIFPTASSPEGVVLALAYCKARNLDVFKRPVHIVPIWSKQLGRLVDSVWPGIGELRTTAARTGQYVGREPVEWGPMIEKKLGSTPMKFPEWARITVYRMMAGQRVAFVGAQVYFEETYATRKHDADDPNEMWQTRPRGQLEKCAEAAALRAAFPEEAGSDYIEDEIRGRDQTSVMVTETAKAPKVKQQYIDAVAETHDEPAAPETGPGPAQNTEAARGTKVPAEPNTPPASPSSVPFQKAAGGAPTAAPARGGRPGPKTPPQGPDSGSAQNTADTGEDARPGPTPGKCHNCGFIIPDSAKFCPECAAARPVQQAEADARSSGNVPGNVGDAPSVDAHGGDAASSAPPAAADLPTDRDALVKLAKQLASVNPKLLGEIRLRMKIDKKPIDKMLSEELADMIADFRKVAAQ